MLSLPLTQWSRVLAGARLVVSAATKHAAEDATVIASRTARHGMDLTSKAQQVVVAAVSSQDTILFPVITQIAQRVATTIHYPQQSVNGFQDNNNNNFHNDPMASPYAPGRNPYESQLQSHRAASVAATGTGNDEHTTISNPATSTSELAPSIKLHSATTKHKDAVVNDDSSVHPKSSTVERISSYRPDPYLIHAQPRTKHQTKSSVTHAAIPADTTPPSASFSLSSLSNHSLEQAIEAETQIYATTTTTAIPSSSTESDFRNTADTPLFLQEGEAVPSTRVGRALGFASLGVGLAWGTASELASRLLFQSSNSSNSNNSSSSIVTSDANADRLAATLCRMRGAALKMGQMLSIQDESLLPPALSRALLQVRQGAHAMPDYQLQQQLESELGTDWRTKFHSFELRPFAAASIGQVHRATLLDTTSSSSSSSSSSNELRQVVVKVQYPGVARSIESDLRNLSMLVTMTGVAPKGLFIENVIRVGRDELKVECNYINEMANQVAFRELVASDPYLVEHGFVVPNVVPELTTNQVLVTEYAPGGTIDKVSHLDQDERNRIGRTILYLTMKELFEWRLMQTDPNWGNFLYDVGRRQTTLIDFGATRTYDKTFVDGYLRIVWASANQEESTLMEQSKHMGFLTGDESDTMLRAHKLSGFTVGEPFWKYTNDEPFDFRGSNISTRMGEHTSVFLRERLT
jgi:aarF domain-containing kinase